MAINKRIPIFMPIVYLKKFITRILFLVLWAIPAHEAHAQGEIEIYVNGHKFDSLQAYLAFKKSAAETSSLTSLTSQQVDYIHKQAQQLGIKVDFRKVKTFQINSNHLSDMALHRFYVLSVEHGVAGALQDFYKTRELSVFPMGRRISSDQLQDVIAQAVAASKYPKLLISQEGKVRIMDMTPQVSSNKEMGAR